MELKFQKVRNVKSPTRGTDKAAGIDFYLPEDIAENPSGNNCYVMDNHTIIIGQGGDVKIPSGIKVRNPEGHSLLFVNKSGIPVNNKLIVGACLIDEDYQGEMSIHLINIGTEMRLIFGGQKIIQGIIINTFSNVKLTEVEKNLFEGHISNRGEDGFGSTGIF